MGTARTRPYLGSAIAERLGIKRWASETHVIVGLWSAEVLHAIRLRTESFRALCPDRADAFANWWGGEPPGAGHTSALIVLDPTAEGRQRQWIDVEAALTTRPRHSGYAEAAGALGGAGFAR